MDFYGNLVEITELVSGLREWHSREADDEIDDDDGPETWSGLFA